MRIRILIGTTVVQIKDSYRHDRRADSHCQEIHVNACVTVKPLDASWKNVNDTTVFKSYLVCYNRNGSALVRELVSVSCKKIKSLTIRARDLISFTTDLQTVNYYSTIHC